MRGRIQAEDQANRLQGRQRALSLTGAGHAGDIHPKLWQDVLHLVTPSQSEWLNLDDLQDLIKVLPKDLPRSHALRDKHQLYGSAPDS